VTIERANSIEIEALALARRSGWPEDMRVLLDRYPREKWEAHANLGEMARFWLPRLQSVLDQLNVHHQIEDFHYFPIFRAADARLAIGFDVLEGDHHHIHAEMARTAKNANALLRALRSDTDTLRRCSDGYADASAVLLKGLIRHLDDEEDLIVPLILDRGEEELGVAHHG